MMPARHAAQLCDQSTSLGQAIRVVAFMEATSQGDQTTCLDRMLPTEQRSKAAFVMLSSVGKLGHIESLDDDMHLDARPSVNKTDPGQHQIKMARWLVLAWAGEL